MYAHEKFKKMLVGGPGLTFAEELVMLERERLSPDRCRVPRSIRVKTFDEFPCFGVTMRREEALEHPDCRLRSRAIDSVMLISMFPGAQYYRDGITVGIEIKSDRGDLSKDRKIQNYIGYTDYLYLAVTPDLLERALVKVRNMPAYGVVDITTGRIWKTSRRQVLSSSRRVDVKSVMLEYYDAGWIKEGKSVLGQNLFSAGGFLEDGCDEGLLYRNLFYYRRLLDSKLSCASLPDRLQIMNDFLETCPLELGDCMPPEEDERPWDDYEYEYK